MCDLQMWSSLNVVKIILFHNFAHKHLYPYIYFVIDILSICIWSHGSWQNTHYAGYRNTPRSYLSHHDTVVPADWVSKPRKDLWYCSVLSGGMFFAFSGIILFLTLTIQKSDVKFWCFYFVKFCSFSFLINLFVRSSR